VSLEILIITENQPFGSFLSGLLIDEGHATTCIRESKEALQVAQTGNIDLIIIELSTAQTGHLLTEERLQNQNATRQIPVIVISDCLELEDELGNVFDFIAKPPDTLRLHEDIAIIAKREWDPANRRTGPLGNADYQLFHDFLLALTGLHFDRRSRKILEMGLNKRMEVRRICGYRDYLQYLKRHGEDRHELQKLLRFLTVGETSFYRYQDHFTALRKLLAATPKSSRLRIWSAGCSTGEEPYSIAMTIMDTFADWQQRDIRILATDINNYSLKRARDGVYRPWAVRNMDKRHLDRYFDRTGESYIVTDHVKSLVEFSHLNLSTDNYPDPARDITELDVVFCRNVTIYFTPATTRKIMAKISASLKPGGHLFLGHAENLIGISSDFDRQRHGACFYYRKLEAALPVPGQLKSRPLSVPPAPPAARSASAPQTVSPDPEELHRQAVRLFDEENFSGAEELVEKILQGLPAHPGALVTKGFILANKGRFPEALALCSDVLAGHDLLADAYFLKGLLLDITNRPVEAVDEYRKAILLEMGFVMAHYHLGRLYVRLDRHSDGVREIRNSLKLLEKASPESVIPFSGGLSREVFMERLNRELTRIS
jgi:chemotaxis protein methyltransferase CheR